jgi:predicted N-acetyltransferase YhbS
MAPSIEAMTPAHVPEVCDLLARAFVHNPLHAAVFGADALEKNRAFFDVGIPATRGHKIVAIDDGRVVGFTNWTASARCQFTIAEQVQLMPPLMRAVGPRIAFRVSRWLSVWAAHDPAEAHLHLGPIAVDPPVQGRGVGSLMMTRYCEALDRDGCAGHLETDRPDNVRFYERSGFVVTEEVVIRGVRNYFMRRPAR